MKTLPLSTTNAFGRKLSHISTDNKITKPEAKALVAETLGSDALRVLRELTAKGKIGLALDGNRLKQVTVSPHARAVFAETVERADAQSGWKAPTLQKKKELRGDDSDVPASAHQLGESQRVGQSEMQDLSKVLNNFLKVQDVAFQVHTRESERGPFNGETQYLVSATIQFPGGEAFDPSVRDLAERMVAEMKKEIPVTLPQVELHFTNKATVDLIKKAAEQAGNKQAFALRYDFGKPRA